MHLIPESWAHWHILLSVFPSVGLLFVMGLYVASLRTNNAGLQRNCLYALAFLGVLAIPTYFSGDYSIAAVSRNPGVLTEGISPHTLWGYAGLVALLATGVASFYELFRSKSSGQLSPQTLNVILVLGAITLGLMIVVGELGWEINHRELRLGQVATAASGLPSGSDIPEGQGTPQTWSHFHMILNHFPTVGFVTGLFFYIGGLLMNNAVMKRGALVLFVICGVLGVPTYVTGAASMWALTDPRPLEGISQAAINAHRDMALWSLFGLGATGVAAWIELWRYRHLGRFSNTTLYVVLALAIITVGLMAETGHRGGQINHPEIRTEPLPTDANAYISPNIEILINNVQWFVPWQTIHFFGYCLIFGTTLAVVLRVLGFWKSLPFSAVHRLLPLGVFGVAMNVFSGMLMLLADTFRYVNATTFPPKMAFIAIGAIAVIYFSLSEQLWAVKAGEDAPATAKWVAVLVLVSWTGVIIGGRLLPYV